MYGPICGHTLKPSDSGTFHFYIWWTGDINCKNITETFCLESGKTELINTMKVSKGAMIRNRYNQVPYLTQDTNGKVTNSKLDTTRESQEVSPFPAADHKAQIKTHAHKGNTNTRQKKHKWSTKEEPPLKSILISYRCLVCMKDPLLIDASSPSTYKWRYE